MNKRMHPSILGCLAPTIWQIFDSLMLQSNQSWVGRASTVIHNRMKNTVIFSLPLAGHLLSVCNQVLLKEIETLCFRCVNPTFGSPTFSSLGLGTFASSKVVCALALAKNAS
jgi:hypothetical protein